MAVGLFGKRKDKAGAPPPQSGGIRDLSGSPEVGEDLSSDLGPAAPMPAPPPPASLADEEMTGGPRAAASAPPRPPPPPMGGMAPMPPPPAPMPPSAAFEAATSPGGDMAMAAPAPIV